MNPEHLKTFLWLRWRLAGQSVQAVRSRRRRPDRHCRGGDCRRCGVRADRRVLVGLIALRTASPRAVMFVWDGAIVGFVFLWFAGLMAELQRTDAISLDRFLHLPVSPSSAFLINFLGSSVSLAMVLVLPAMIGLAAGLVLSRGLGHAGAVPAGGRVLPDDVGAVVPVPRLAGQRDGEPAAPADRRGRRAGGDLPAGAVAERVEQHGPGRQERRDARAETRRVISEAGRGSQGGADHP